ncbi:hypothetical protein D3C76_1844330 [compost metagenome]
MQLMTVRWIQSASLKQGMMMDTPGVYSGLIGTSRYNAPNRYRVIRKAAAIKLYRYNTTLYLR